jgi:type IV pilus assembly protein PilP
MKLIKSTVRFFIVIIGLTMLMACDPSEDSELRRYIDEVKARKARPIEPIPEFTPMTKFSYPENEHRRSPFKPIPVPQQIDVYAPNTNRPKEPLEAFPLDALKFVGILKEGPVVWGLIRQPDGLVSRVKVGDYMGKNFGQVRSIQETGIEIEETVQDTGKWEKKPFTLKLNTPTQESGKTQ